MGNLKVGQEVTILKGKHKGLNAIISNNQAFNNGVELELHGEKIYNGSFSSFPSEWVKPV